MTGIIEILQARIAEDEAAVRQLEISAYATHEHAPDAGPDASPLTTGRVLAECSAKRKILGNVPLVTDIAAEIGGTREYVLMCLASVYRQHTDYQEGWAVDERQSPDAGPPARPCQPGRAHAGPIQDRHFRGAARCGVRA